MSENYIGRAWAVTVKTADGRTYAINSNVPAGTEPLRITFDVKAYALLAYWSADIKIYNLSPSMAQMIVSDNPNIYELWKFNQPLVLGDTVSLSAGYVDSSGLFHPIKSEIFSGRILQARWIREGVVDYTLSIRCVTGLLEDALNFVSRSVAGGFTAMETLNQICVDAGLALENIDDNARALLESVKLPRAQVFFGRPYEQIKQLTRQAGLMCWMTDRGLNVRSFNTPAPASLPDIAYGPPGLLQSPPVNGSPSTIKGTMIGTPEQTQEGATFRVLLDSGVRVGDTVRIAPGALVNLFPLQINALPPVPNRNGVYVAAGVRHAGDSRGQNDSWYTEITGVTYDFFASFLMPSVSAATSALH